MNVIEMVFNHSSLHVILEFQACMLSTSVIGLTAVESGLNGAI